MSQVPFLTARTLVLAKIEVTNNVDPVPTAADNAMLVADVDVRIAVTPLDRNNYRPSISPSPSASGRKLVTVSLSHEIRGSGANQTPPALGTFLRACGFAQTVITVDAANQIDTAVRGPANGGPDITFAKDVAPTSRYGKYRVNVVTAGASTTAAVQVTGDPLYEGDTTVLKSLDYTAVTDSAAGTVSWNVSDLTAPVLTVGGTWVIGETATLIVGGVRFVVTATGTTATATGDDVETALLADGRFTGTANSTGTVTVDFSTAAGAVVLTSGSTAIPLGASVAEVTGTWTGSLTALDYWDIPLLRAGVHYTPVSTGFESITMYVYFDGKFHSVTGCMGTFTMEGAAGNLASASFTFTGQYIAPTDVALPSGAVYESTVPSQVELANLVFGNPGRVGFYDPCAESFSIDMGNTVNPRDCMNASDGFNGVSITGRSVNGGVNPETVTEAVYDFWTKLAEGTQVPVHLQVGSVVGNIMHIESYGVQYSDNVYADRNGNRTYDLSLAFRAVSGDGDDEIRFVFA